MKLSNIAFAALATSAAAIPHGLQARPNPVRRDPAAVTTAILDYERAVLYVDQNGNRVATSMVPVDYAEAQPTVNAADSGSTFEEPSPYEPAVSEAVSTTPSTTASYSTPTETSSSSGYDSQEVGDDVSSYSIAYSPYNGDHSCKTEDQIKQDMAHLSKYAMVRIYGTDCDQVPYIMAAAKDNEQKVFAGIWDPNNAAAEAQLLIDGVDDWDMIHSVSVGNEFIARGGSASSVITGIDVARTALQKGGYNGTVTTVDVFSTIMQEENRGLCDAVDYVAANCHAFFNSEITAAEAGDWVREQAEELRRWCGGNKDVVITESGWPTDGQTNGKAVPGLENQQAAIQSLKDAYADSPGEVVLFSAFNDPWKEDYEGTFGTEHYWGIYGSAPSAR